MNLEELGFGLILDENMNVDLEFWFCGRREELMIGSLRLDLGKSEALEKKFKNEIFQKN